jgi:hypothetical protein
MTSSVIGAGGSALALHTLPTAREFQGNATSLPGHMNSGSQQTFLDFLKLEYVSLRHTRFWKIQVKYLRSMDSHFPYNSMNSCCDWSALVFPLGFPRGFHQSQVPT